MWWLHMCLRDGIDVLVATPLDPGDTPLAARDY